MSRLGPRLWLGYDERDSDDFARRKLRAIDVILIGAATADRARLGRGNFAHRKKRHLLIDYEWIECRKWVFENGDLNVVVEHRKLAGIADQWIV